MLMNALHVVASHATHRYPATTEYLKILGYRHHQRQIPPGLYPKFSSAMLSALEQFHGESWSPALDRLWREAFDLASAAMLTGYVKGPLYY
jgi:hemoglobin-like flavoprotein